MILPPATTFLVDLNESFDASIIGFFDIIWEETSGELSHFSMVMQAVATFSFSIAGIGTVAVLIFVLFF
jgi:hypothetical protein